MELFATPLSHFSRKVRVLLDHLGVAYEVVDVGNVADAEAFAGNPLMSVPVLREGELWLVDSDHIAAYVARRFDPGDRYEVLTNDPAALNARAVMNGVMANEVKLILAERTGLRTEGAPYFGKARRVIENGLSWLDQRAARFTPAAPRYVDFHLACMWDHLAYYGTVPLASPRLAEIAASLRAQATIARTAPEVLKPKA